MTTHDPLCHAAAFDYHDPECCDCALIVKVRADERVKALFATSTVHRDEWAELRAQVEALRDEAAASERESHDHGYQEAEFEYQAEREALEKVLALFDGEQVMAQLPGGEWLVQLIGEEVIVFQRYTELEIVRYDVRDGSAAARAQKVIYDSELLTDEQKCFAHFWCGYFHGVS